MADNTSPASSRTDVPLEDEKNKLAGRRSFTYSEGYDAAADVRFHKGGEFIDERGRRVYRTTTAPPLIPSWARFIPGGWSKKWLIPLKGNRMMWAIKGFAGVAILFFGYDQGVMGSVNESHNYKQLMGVDSNPQTDRDAAALGGIVAVYYGGTLIGALIGGVLGDRIGRLKCITIASTLATIGAVIQASSFTITQMTIGRVVTGLGTGCINVVIPLLCSELSSAHTRGATLAFEFVINIAGVCVAYWLGFGLKFRSNRSSSFSFRFPLALQIVFIIILMLMLPFFPESPRWLARMGREDEARYILAQCRTEDGDEDAEIVNQEMYDILEVAELERSHEMSYTSMLFKKDPLNIRRRVWLSICIQLWQEFTGIGAVTAFAATVFRQAGYSDEKASLLSGVNDVTYLLAVFIAVALIDRVGRRKTLFAGSVIMALALFLATIGAHYVPRSDGSQRNSWGALVTFSIFLYTACFGATWLTVPWLYPTEIFPSFVRCKGSTFSVCGWSVGNGVIMMLTPFLFTAIGEYAFLFFGLLTVSTIPVIYFFYPETANRGMEEMNILFTGPIFVHGQQKMLKELAASDPELYHAMEIGDRATIERKRGHAASKQTEHREHA